MGVQTSYRWDNARRDKLYGKVKPGVRIDTRELADKVRVFWLETSFLPLLSLRLLILQTPEFRYVPWRLWCFLLFLGNKYEVYVYEWQKKKFMTSLDLHPLLTSNQIQTKWYWLQFHPKSSSESWSLVKEKRRNHYQNETQGVPCAGVIGPTLCLKRDHVSVDVKMK